MNFRFLYTSTIVLAGAALLFDVWTFSLRCGSSPPVDVSRFGFAVLIQLSAVSIPFVHARWFADKTRSAGLKMLLVAIVVLVSSSFMARQTVLLSDTANDKFFQSRGYLCPGVGE